MNGVPHILVRLAGGLLAAATLAGCSQMTRPEQAQQGQAVDEADFLHVHLQAQPVVTVAEAYRAVLMLAEGQDRPASFEEREAELIARKIVRPAWKLQRDQAIDKATIAYMVLAVLDVRGGVNRMVFGSLGLGDRRYALREAIYMDLMPPASEHRYLTGGELVDLLARADAYMAEHGMYPAEHVDIEQTVRENLSATQPGN